MEQKLLGVSDLTEETAATYTCVVQGFMNWLKWTANRVIVSFVPGTGISNSAVHPQVYTRSRVTREPLAITGTRMDTNLGIPLHEGWATPN